MSTVIISNLAVASSAYMIFGDEQRESFFVCHQSSLPTTNHHPTNMLNHNGRTSSIDYKYRPSLTNFTEHQFTLARIDN